METNNQMKQPFFAKFLEGQIKADTKKNQDGTQQSSTSTPQVIGDGGAVTLKFPSDSDEGL
ncbi:hypothetical protein GCM10023231_24030 [Olivibacter ginsenosidimutans]|uniref:Serine endopeptidase n=1 Tax=Olivibacter ginsenosidimutans TaxID=1176537 RepID=A0ABP9BFG1_9SPHI